MDLTQADIPTRTDKSSMVTCFGREEHDGCERRDHLRPTGPTATLRYNHSKMNTVVRPRTVRDTAVEEQDKLLEQHTQWASDMTLTSSKSALSPMIINTLHRSVDSRPSSLESNDDMALPDGGYRTISDINNFSKGEDSVGCDILNTFDNCGSAVVDAEDYEPSITDSRPPIILTLAIFNRFKTFQTRLRTSDIRVTVFTSIV